jgi:hypothetical protein
MRAITCGSSMLAMIFSVPPQWRQVSSGTSLCPTASRQSATVQIGYPADLCTSILNTRFRRCIQVIARCLSLVVSPVRCARPGPARGPPQ